MGTIKKLVIPVIKTINICSFLVCEYLSISSEGSLIKIEDNYANDMYFYLIQNLKKCDIFILNIYEFRSNKTKIINFYFYCYSNLFLKEPY